MEPQMILELVGYFASVLVLISLLMTSVVKLRVINMIGSFIFAVYALLIHSYPTAVMNFCLVGINIFYLVRIIKTERIFTLVPAAPGEAYVRHFLQYYREDIQKYFSGFDGALSQADTVFLVCCDAAPAGILTGRTMEQGALEVSLDYSTPQYRDCSVGQYLYRQLAERGCRRLVVPAASEVHGDYLKKMGFVQEGQCYIKDLTK